MKGILMFDNLNDLVYFDADDVLAQHIQNLAMKDGLLEDFSFRNNNGIVDRNIVMQLFSPLIASYKVMQAQFGNKYTSIESEDGVLLVFNEILNYIIIGISSTEENLVEVEQEICFFLVLVKMLYGPSLHMMKCDITTSCDNCTRSELLSRLISKWRLLKMEQQMFLVEAVERLIINQDITAMCVNVLQEALEKIRSSDKDGSYCHAFMLVDTKLLALYSSRNSGQLPKEQLLLLTLVVQVFRSSFPATEEDAQDLERKKDAEQFFVPISKSPKTEVTSDGRLSERLIKNITKEDGSGSNSELSKGARSLLIYMKSRAGSLVPHMLCVVQVTHKIMLVTLCEMTAQGTTSSVISELVDSLFNIQYHPSSRPTLSTFEQLELVFKTLIDSIWKLKMLDDNEVYMKKLISKWEQMKQCGITAFLEQSSQEPISPRLESSISSLCEVLRHVFEEIIARPLLKYEEMMKTPERQEVLLNIQKMSMKKLKDTADYLEVKAVQNITMSSYIAEFPGLIHFIYVDRSSDCVIAPAVILKKGHLNGTTSLKNKIWKMVSFGRRYVDGANNFCSLWKEDDLYFFYTIWFEDSLGRAIKPTIYPDIKEFPMKGILCGNFYKKLVQECFPSASYDHIFCYELFCVHLESTSMEQIVDHSRRLCSQLWDFTGAYRTSLDLL